MLVLVSNPLNILEPVPLSRPVPVIGAHFQNLVRIREKTINYVFHISWPNNICRFTDMIIASDYYPYPTLNLRRPSFSSRRRLDLELSSAARHIRAVISRRLHSLEDILLRTGQDS